MVKCWMTIKHFLLLWSLALVVCLMLRGVMGDEHDKEDEYEGVSSKKKAIQRRNKRLLNNSITSEPLTKKLTVSTTGKSYASY